MLAAQAVKSRLTSGASVLIGVDLAFSLRSLANSTKNFKWFLRWRRINYKRKIHYKENILQLG